MASPPTPSDSRTAALTRLTHRVDRHLTDTPHRRQLLPNACRHPWTFHITAVPQQALDAPCVCHVGVKSCPMTESDRWDGHWTDMGFGTRYAVLIPSGCISPPLYLAATTRAGPPPPCHITVKPSTANPHPSRLCPMTLDGRAIPGGEQGERVQAAARWNSGCHARCLPPSPTYEPQQPSRTPRDPGSLDGPPAQHSAVVVPPALHDTSTNLGPRTTANGVNHK